MSIKSSLILSSNQCLGLNSWFLPLVYGEANIQDNNSSQVVVQYFLALYVLKETMQPFGYNLQPLLVN